MIHQAYSALSGLMRLIPKPVKAVPRLRHFRPWRPPARRCRERRPAARLLTAAAEEPSSCFAALPQGRDRRGGRLPGTHSLQTNQQPCLQPASRGCACCRASCPGVFQALLLYGRLCGPLPFRLQPEPAAVRIALLPGILRCSVPNRDPGRLCEFFYNKCKKIGGISHFFTIKPLNYQLL